MRVDAHQHFWQYSPGEYGWISDSMSRLRRDFLPAHLEMELDRFDFDGSIVVQARQTLEETRWLLELARSQDRILGVVGWVDLRSPRVDEQLQEFEGETLLKGVRHIVQDEDDAFMERADFRRGVAHLQDTPLLYEILIYPRQLEAAASLVQAFPDQAFVLDHLAKPDLRGGALDAWKGGLRRLASFPNVACKVSGLVTEAKWDRWRHEDFFPCLDTALECFGPDRLLFGSDWPVCLLAAPYASVYGIALAWARALTKSERVKIFGTNARRVYGL